MLSKPTHLPAACCMRTLHINHTHTSTHNVSPNCDLKITALPCSFELHDSIVYTQNEFTHAPVQVGGAQTGEANSHTFSCMVYVN